MALEELLAANTAAIEKNTAALLKGGVSAGAVAAAAGDKKGPGRPKAITADEVKAIAERVKTEKGRPAAVALINQHGAASLAELDKAKYAEFLAAAQVLLSQTEPEADEPAADDEL